MLFSRSYSFSTNMPPEQIKSSLIGSHVKIHNMDFEVYERDRLIKIIPHAEQEENIKTLPITHVEFDGKGEKTLVRVSSKIRKLDQGGPYLIVTFCLFMLMGAVGFYFFGGTEYTTFTFVLLGICLVIFTTFWIRMQSGYFDYVHKIKNFVKEKVVTH